MKKIKQTFLLIACLLMINPTPSSAGGGGFFFGATEWTQIANNIQLAGLQYKELVQIYYQLRQLSNMTINGWRVPYQTWGNTQTQLMQLARIVREGQALAYSAANIDREFRNKFKNYDDYLNTHMGITDFSDKYEQWGRTNLDTIKASLKAANLQNAQFASEEQTLSVLQRQSETAQGRMQAIQAGNQIAAQQVRQTQKLRSLMMSQMQMQAAYMASETEEKSLKKSQRARLHKTNDTVLGNEGRY